MSRKPYPKYLLTTDEHDVLQKLSEELKVDSWFAIAGSDIAFVTGEVMYPSRCNGLYDEIFDAETRRYISLQTGIRWLNEAFEADVEVNSQWLTHEELSIYKGLLEKLKIPHYWNLNSQGKEQ